MMASLPADKLQRIRSLLATWLRKRKATKREILSLVGLLQHATKVVKPGRTFVARMYSEAARLCHLSFFTRLSKDFRSDLRWWHLFVHTWNGVSFLECSPTPRPPDVFIETDASGSWGCGALFNNLWFQLQWSTEWKPMDIMAKELVPIVLSCAVWGPLLPRKILEFKCDNQGLVDAINKGSSKEPVVMHLLGCLWFFSAFFEITIRAAHIPELLTQQQIGSLETKQLSFYIPILMPPTSQHKSQPHCCGSRHLHALTGPPEPSCTILGTLSTRPSGTHPVPVSKDSNYPHVLMF